MKTKKIAFPVLIAVLMAFAVMSITTEKVSAEDTFPLYVGGTQVTQGNCGNIKAGDANWSGKASYDPSTNTLTLDNFRSKNPIDKTGIHCSMDLTIALKGSNYIQVRSNDSPVCGIEAQKNQEVLNLTIQDDPSDEVVGELTLETGGDEPAWVYGISVVGSLTISKCKVTTEAYGGRVLCYGTCGGRITIEDGILTATAEHAEGDHRYGIGTSDWNGGEPTLIAFKGESEVIASGDSEAIKGSVSNETLGKGWTDIDGTEGEEAIDINTSDEGRGLRNQDDKVFKKVHFRDFVPLTITAKDQTYTYNGKTQGEGDPVYADAAEIAEKVTVKGLRDSDELASVILNGEASEIGEYPIEVYGAAIKNKTDDSNVSDEYLINYVPGKLTINPIPLAVTINGSSAKKTCNGKQQTYTGTVTAKSSDPVFDASKFSYKGSTVVKGTKEGVYTRELAAKECVYSDPNCNVDFTVGSPVRLTIDPVKISGTPLPKMTAKGKTSLVLAWSKVTGASGYDIFFAPCDLNGKKTVCKKVKTIKGNKTFKWTKSGLKKGVAYKAVVKAYAYKDGKKTYVRTGPMIHAYTSGGTKNFTNAKSVTVNTTSVALNAGKTYQIKADVTKLQKGKKLMPSGHAPKLRYYTSSKKIATVSKSGKIKAKAKGSCKIYVVAVSGASKTVKVTVK